MRRKAMEIKEKLLVFMFFFHLCVFALSSSALHQEALPSDFVQNKISRGERTNEQSNYSVHGSDTSKSTIKHRSNIEHGIGRGTNSGARPHPGEAGSDGGYKTPSTQGGTNYIPVYAAGAANNRHQYHRGAANCNQIGASTLVAATVASFLHLYGVFRWV